VVIMETAESPERIAFFRDEVHRLCPMQRLLSDAGVPLDVEWVAQPPAAQPPAAQPPAGPAS
jgi:hypothetical protein